MQKTLTKYKVERKSEETVELAQGRKVLISILVDIPNSTGYSTVQPALALLLLPGSLTGDLQSSLPSSTVL